MPGGERCTTAAVVNRRPQLPAEARLQWPGACRGRSGNRLVVRVHREFGEDEDLADQARLISGPQLQTTGGESRMVSG